MRWLLMLMVACSGGTDSDKDTSGTDSNDSASATTETGVTTDTDTDTTEVTVTVPDPSGDPATVDLAGACPLETRQGGFIVQDNESYSVIDGTVTNGVVPITVLELMDQIDGCSLLRRNIAFCDPGCQAGETCDFNGECIPFPVGQHLNTVTVGGLDDSGTPFSVVMQPIGSSNNYFNTQLPHPAMSPGNLIELRTGLGVWDETPFVTTTLHGIGVEPLEYEGEEPLIITDGQDLQITWGAPSTPGRTELYLEVNIDQHGNTPVKLFCNLPDTGSGSIPASLVSQLINFGVSGFPSIRVARQTVDHTIMPDGGCMDFTVLSARDGNVRVDGFTPCTSDNDCPTGQTCNTAIELCQ